MYEDLSGAILHHNMPPHTLPPYGGSKTSLVLSIDLGTTYSGVSYAVLDPGVEPVIKPVMRSVEMRAFYSFLWGY